MPSKIHPHSRTLSKAPSLIYAAGQSIQSFQKRTYFLTNWKQKPLLCRQMYSTQVKSGIFTHLFCKRFYSSSSFTLSYNFNRLLRCLFCLSGSHTSFDNQTPPRNYNTTHPNHIQHTTNTVTLPIDSS
jgi:hypothetical protein